MNKINLKNELIYCFRKQKNQIRFYRPSIFWEEACNKIFKRAIKTNFSNFRADKLNMNYFIPSYRYLNYLNKINLKKVNKLFSLNKKNKKLLHSFVSGYQNAVADYRTFIASTEKQDRLNLRNFSESNFGSPKEQYSFDGKKYSKSSLNYLLGLSFLQSNLDKKFNPKIILEIGGGYGTLGEILKKSNLKNFKYINVDVAPIIFFSKLYLSKVFNIKKIKSFKQFDRWKTISVTKLNKINFFCPWQLKKLKGKISLFVNFISFQEMEPDIVKNYLDFVINLKPQFILLRNLREGKNLKSGLKRSYVKKPVTTKFYLNTLRKFYKLNKSDAFTFGEKKIDGFHSEILLFKRI